MLCGVCQALFSESVVFMTCVDDNETVIAAG